ncbi:MAG: hypothetical protein H7320_24530 [Ferruginibacter sp.]|nr:hypothetical protein [Ferruginibacter sp.]
MDLKLKNLPAIFYKCRFVIALVCALLLLLSSCKKLALLSGDQSTLEKYFAENVLNRNFIVDFASNSGTDITSQYTGYNFVLTKDTSFYNGNMTGTKDGVTYSGTWTSNSDYSKLVINLNSPSIPVEFVFLNRAWKFTKKGVPVLNLAPWGNTEPKILYMRRL